MIKIAKYNTGYHYILSTIDIFSHYVWKEPLGYKFGNEVVRTFIKNFNETVPENCTFYRNNFVTDDELKANYAEKIMIEEICKYFTYTQSYHYIDAL